MFLPEPEFDEGIIVEQPNLMTRTRRLTEWSVSVFLWALWFYVMRPTIAVMLWAAGIRFFYTHMITLRGLHDPKYFSLGLLCILLILITILVWNLYDRLRYSGRYKGRSRGSADNPNMAAFFGMSEDQVQRLKDGNRVDVYFREANALEFGLDPTEERIPGFFAPQQIELHFVRMDRV